MKSRARWGACLGFLAVTAAYAVWSEGADAPIPFAVTLLLLGLAGVLAWLLGILRPPLATSRTDRVVAAAAILFPAYAAIQLLPLPVPLVGLLSPTRAEIAYTLASLTNAAWWVPLTVSAPTTWLHLGRISGYAIVFFLVRRLTRQSPWGPWAAALPLVVLGGLAAAWGLVSHDGNAGGATGTYPNRNHFAGLLEMILPWSLAYGLWHLRRDPRYGVLTVTAVARAAVPLGMAAVMFAAIAMSNSKAGVMACFLSLLVMVALVGGRGLSTARRAALAVVLACVFVAGIVFLTPASLVERFSAVVSEQPSEGRVPVWRDTLLLIAAYPLFGSGFGAFFPAFLRYQIAGAGLAWTNTHNDYLQLLSELGIVGFIAPAVLMGGAFLIALRAATTSSAGPDRLMGVGAIGSLLALGVHSFTDFNTYVTANGLVLAWVTGLAAACRSGSAERNPVATARRTLFGVMPVAGCLVAGYGAAWLLYLSHSSNNIAAERLYCRFGVCDTTQALLLEQQARGVDENGLLPPEILLAYLDRDRAAPYRWAELGLSFQTAGRADEARDAFERAVALGPTSTPALLMAADFQFQKGARKQGFDLVARALGPANPQQYNFAFATLDVRRIPATEALGAISPGRAAALAWLRWTIRAEAMDLTNARAVWAWLVAHGDVDPEAERDYLRALVGRREERAAWDDWLRYAGTKDYPAANHVFDGGFERDPGEGPYDWRVQPVEGVKAAFEPRSTEKGRRVLRLDFDGTRNVTDTGVSQRMYLDGGCYVLSARRRSQSLTTDRGVAVTVRGDASAPAVDAVLDPLRGTTEWDKTRTEFCVASGGGFVTLSVSRPKSLKFDSLVSGTVWVDDVAITQGRAPFGTTGQ